VVRFVYLTVAVGVAIGVSASAQTNNQPRSGVQSTSGVVKTVSASSLTVQRGDNEITFGVDASTRIVAAGRGAKTGPRDLVLRIPPPTPKITDFVKAGDQVTVKYRQSGNAMIAAEVRVARK
jgi:hypothetical protein